MMREAQAFHRYEQCLDLHQEMLAVAQRGDWDALLAKALEYATCIETLKASGVQILSGDARRARNELIQRILDIDAEVKRLITAWMAKTQEDLQSKRIERQLGKAYGGA